jgi:hypothetical protein
MAEIFGYEAPRQLTWARTSTSGRDAGPATPREATDPARSEMRAQLSVSAVSSMTNDVCRDESSVPVKLTVTVWPAKDETLNERSW